MFWPWTLCDSFLLIIILNMNGLILVQDWIIMWNEEFYVKWNIFSFLILIETNWSFSSSFSITWIKNVFPMKNKQNREYTFYLRDWKRRKKLINLFFFLTTKGYSITQTWGSLDNQTGIKQPTNEALYGTILPS